MFIYWILRRPRFTLLPMDAACYWSIDPGLQRGSDRYPADSISYLSRHGNFHWQTANIGFACLGLGQPFGFSVDFVFGGLCQEFPLGWRFGYYLCAGITVVVNFSKLPKDKPREPVTIRRLQTETDWIEILLSSSCLGIISYGFAVITDNPSRIQHAQNIVLLCAAAAVIPSFLGWTRWRQKAGKSALIPNSLWKKTGFATICVVILLSWAVLNGAETILSLAAIRFLPSVLIGMVLNLATGLMIHRFHANHLILVTTALSAVSPLSMAIINLKWPWWHCAFWAMLLGPLSADVIFTVANLIIADSFTTMMQGLAGAVFNTVTQFGAFGSSYQNKSSSEALMVGYRAVFWACFGLMVAASGVGAWGLCKVGKVGPKRE
ncbi:hypothetical protein EYZ11_004939 [Aspergillus tanneri]|uniref:Major facilitator superfamily (MFS) profile domain-containing protein n=1 Tax=Aspergillus tanneri TaxID=1220188 RepID=A0A4S3JLI3_9EURO|nr:hypothetical protein EYZ11_004939 [Aspergillus tanneri]